MTAAHYNGKIEAPRLFSRALTGDEIEAVKDGGWRSLSDVVVGAWSFSRDFDTELVTDESPNELHGRAHNMPARAMTGHNWSGAESNFQGAPREE